MWYLAPSPIFCKFHFFKKNSPTKIALDFGFEKVENIRIDTHKDNKIMIHLLEKYGFKRCGVIVVDDGTDREAFQKIKE